MESGFFNAVREKCLLFFMRPLFFASLCISFLVYACGVPVKDGKQYHGLVQKECLVEITGSVVSNCTKTSGGKYYSVDLELTEAVGMPENKNSYPSEIRVSCCGRLKVMVSASEAESLYPGKLYSLSRNGGLLLESGERIRCSGRWSERMGAFVSRESFYCGHGESLLGRIKHFRAYCRLVFRRLMFSWGSAGGFILSLLSGSREYLDEKVAADFRGAGLSHILALSGMHLSFFASLSGRSGSFVFGKKFSQFFRLAGILFFVWFAGFSPSLMRAFIFSLILMACRRNFCRNIDSLEVLGVTFLVHVSLHPGHVTSIAFVLSYTALAGILMFSGKLDSFFVRSVPPRISSSLAASVSAQICTVPVSAAVFGGFAPLGVVAACVVSPLVTVFMGVSVIFIFLCLLLPFFSAPFGCILDLFYTIIVKTAGAFARVPQLNLNF